MYPSYDTQAVFCMILHATLYHSCYRKQCLSSVIAPLKALEKTKKAEIAKLPTRSISNSVTL